MKKEEGPFDRDKAEPAPTGNASNPSSRNNDLEPEGNQLIDERGEKYIREVASIEDYPDAEDEQGMEEELSSEEK